MWLKDLNIRHDTIKHLEEFTGKTFSDVNHTTVFFSQSPRAIQIKTKNKQMGPNQTYTSFCIVKETINKMKRQPMKWEKIFAKHVTDKGLISKIYKQLILLSIQEATHTHTHTRQKM